MNEGEDLIASQLGDSRYDPFNGDAVGRSEPMPLSNNTEKSRTAWQRCIAHLVVGGSTLASTTVVLLQALPPLLHGFP
jgi:hypothetical protein